MFEELNARKCLCCHLYLTQKCWVLSQAYCSSVSTRPCLAGDVDWIAAIFGLRTALHLCAMNVTLYMENSAVLDLVSN